MGMRRWLKSLAGRKGGATHSGTPGSHVNTKRNKQSAHKAERLNWREELKDILNTPHIQSDFAADKANYSISIAPNVIHALDAKMHNDEFRKDIKSLFIPGQPDPTYKEIHNYLYEKHKDD